MASKGTKKHGQRAMVVVLAAVLTVSPLMTRAQENQEGGKGWFLLALLPRVAEAIIGAFTSNLAQGGSCVFSRLLSFMGATDNPNCKPKNNPQPASPEPASNQFNAPPATPATPAQAATLSEQPILAFIVKKLSDSTPNGQETGDLLSDKFAQGGAPTFNIHTNDAFAIAFSTSVPGRVRLINTDVDGIVSTSSIYEAIPGSDNRMPRITEGGILMTGKPGTEYLDVEFTPCISQSLAQEPRVAVFANQLTACSNEAATRQYRPAQASGKGGSADFGGKAMQFPPNANPGQPVAIPPGNYAKGEPLRFRITINHAKSAL